MLSFLPTPRPGRIVIALLLPLLAAGAPATADLDKAWTALADLRPKDVLRRIDESTTARPARLARAAALMSLEPASDENLREADGVFRKLAAGDDEIAAAAAYLRARLYQLHDAEPDYAKAAEIYRELAARQPQSHWAQLGLVKLAVLELYVLPPAGATDRLASAEARLAQIHEPLLQRDLNLQIGQAGVVLKQPLKRILPHLIAADRIGGISATAREDLVVQIGVLSQRAGLLAQAKEYYERYLREYPERVRAYAVTRRLEETKRLLAKEAGS